MKPVIKFFEYTPTSKYLWAMFEWNPLIDENIVKLTTLKKCGHCKSENEFHGYLNGKYLCVGDWVLYNPKEGNLHVYDRRTFDKFFRETNCSYEEYLKRMNK